MSPSATFTQASSQTFADEVVLSANSTIDIDAGNFSVGIINGLGGNIRVDGGTLILTSGVSQPRRTATITVAPAGNFLVGGQAELELAPSLNIINEGELKLDRILSGRGLIAGNGFLDARPGAMISPGSYLGGGGLINTLQVENQIYFRRSPSNNSPQYLAHIDVTGGTARNDLLEYHNGDVHLSGVSSILVEPVRRLTAKDLDGQSFTVISSRSAASTGSVVRGGRQPTVTEAGNVPALIDFRVTNQLTNGRDDVTLTALKQPVNSLISHPGVTTKNHAGAVRLLSHAYGEGNTAIGRALDSLLNSEVGTHVETLHPKPYSSWLTVKLEQADQILTAALSNTQGTDRGLWLHTGRIEGDIDGEDDLGNFEYQLDNIVLGGDVTRTQDWGIGVFAGFGSSSMDEHDSADQSFSAQSYRLGGYGWRQLGDWQLRAAAGFSYSDHDTKRAA